MSNKCGDCGLFEGANVKCGGGQTARNSNSTACNHSFKGPASLFSGEKCGGCKLFEGNNVKCGGGQTARNSNSTACNRSYAPIPG